MKPIRFGYKAWCLNTDDGYLVTLDLYQGRTYEGNELNGKVFGKCAATVLKNIDSLSEDKQSLPYNIYLDNLFTSFKESYTLSSLIWKKRMIECHAKKFGLV